MSHAITKGLALAIATVPLLIACGGGHADDPGPINPPQCSGASCGVQGPPPSQGSTAALCPPTDQINTTFLGGAGSGEIVKLTINAPAMTYSLSWLQSPVPETVGQVTPTRAGTNITGAVMHPPAGTLPTDEQTRCAFILLPGTGTTAEGAAYSTASFFNQANPPMILVGLGGVAGGGTPGSEISYPGIAGLLAVPDRKFDFYPFIGFANTSNNLSDLQGTYNTLTYHIHPTSAWAAAGNNATETFDASGNCTATTPPSGGTGCWTTGAAWVPTSDGYFTSQDAPRLEGLPMANGIPLPLPIAANANMVLGKLNGAIVPVVVRTGVANPNTLTVDDESGIAFLAAANAVTSGGIDGGYVGADSNFRYTATLIQGPAGGFINPSTQQGTGGFGLQYAGQTSPGLISATDLQGNPGFVVAAGGLYAVLLQGEENGGITPSSAIPGQTTSSVPYFGIGAQISK